MGRGGKGRFQAHQPAGDSTDLRLDVGNYVLDYWGEGRAATYADLPVIGRGPFGQAVRFQPQKGNDFRPMLFVPRARLHNSGLDVKGAGASVSMVVWMARETGGHAVAGIWHEGTDLHSLSPTIRRVEKGMRQYCLFMGLAANPGASAAHISENGGPSFSDQFARNLSTTPDKIPNISASASAEEIDRGWSVAGFTFDNQKNQVTSYLNGVAKEYWIEQPEKHPFFSVASERVGPGGTAAAGVSGWTDLSATGRQAAKAGGGFRGCGPAGGVASLRIHAGARYVGQGWAREIQKGVAARLGGVACQPVLVSARHL